MKTLIITTFLCIGLLGHAQLFENASKRNFMVGATIASKNAGLFFSYEERLGKYLSLGINPIILLGKQSYTDSNNNRVSLKFGDKFDIKGRLSVHFADVLKIQKFDIYPGLNVGIHNLGFHTGAQFYLAEGFAGFGEVNIPLSKYKDNSHSSLDKTYYSLGLTLDL